jgi:HPt (histidine-containing phosphotransfer) domain-containing protein
MDRGQFDNTAACTDASEPPLVDPERVIEVIDLICEGEPAAFDRWIGYLEADIAKLGALLRNTGTNENDRAIQGAAHSLKGTCMNLGVPVLAALFAELEQYAKEGKSEALTQRYAQGRDLEARSIHALREFAAKCNVPTGDS